MSCITLKERQKWAKKYYDAQNKLWVLDERLGAYRDAGASTVVLEKVRVARGEAEAELDSLCSEFEAEYPGRDLRVLFLRSEFYEIKQRRQF